MQTLILLALVIVIGWILFRPITKKELDRYNDKDWPDINLQNKKLFLKLVCLMFSSNSFGNEIIRKSMKCEIKKETIRGQPFYFFFEDLDNVQSYFINKTDEIKFRNLSYEEVKSNIIEIRYVGEIDKNNLILIHTKGREEYNCSCLSSKKQLNKELEEFAKKGNHKQILSNSL